MLGAAYRADIPEYGIESAKKSGKTKYLSPGGKRQMTAFGK